MEIAKEKLIEIRHNFGLNQTEFADLLGINRSLLSKLENGLTAITPTMSAKLLKKLKEAELKAMNNIALEPQENDYASSEFRKAKAGLAPVSNTNAKIRQLIASSLDQFPDGQYDIYEVEGMSMFPSLQQGDRLLCRAISIDEIIDNRIYVILVNKADLTEYRKSGIWVKRLQNRRSNGYINCKSDNKDTTEPFPTFRLKPAEIIEIWYPVMKMTFNMADPNRDLYDKIDELESRIEMLEEDNKIE